jgi:hypothetical protein
MLSPFIKPNTRVTFPLKVFSYQNMKSENIKWNLRTKGGQARCPHEACQQKGQRPLTKYQWWAWRVDLDSFIVGRPGVGRQKSHFVCESRGHTMALPEEMSLCTSWYANSAEPVRKALA